MYGIQITNNIQNSITLIPDYFIDHHLAKASGDYVKVYLYIQRHLKGTTPLTVPNIADSLYMTEADVNRALLYWKQTGVLTFQDEAAEETAVSLAVPEKRNLNPAVIHNRMDEEGISHLAFMADTYLGKPLTQTELNTLFYFYDGLHFPVDLIEYLLEYCVSNNKKSMRYIETVALSWFEQGIDTRAKAQEAMKIYNKNYYAVMKAFGLSNRNPGPAEAAFIGKWLEEYRFDLNVILEACNRTLANTSQPSFPYADSILQRWKKANVHTINDIKALDNQFHSNKKMTGRTPLDYTSSPSKPAMTKGNQFHNFEQRSYDYQDLEQQFIRKVNGIPPQK